MAHWISQTAKLMISSQVTDSIDRLAIGTQPFWTLQRLSNDGVAYQLRLQPPASPHQNSHAAQSKLSSDAIVVRAST